MKNCYLKRGQCIGETEAGERVRSEIRSRGGEREKLWVGEEDQVWAVTKSMGVGREKGPGLLLLQTRKREA